MSENTRYGATPEAWRRFSDTIGLTADLLPVVANPTARIAQRSTMQAIGKTPSLYDAHREVVGIGSWSKRVSSSDDVARWSREPDYAMCVQARTIRAIDVDVPDHDKADAIERTILTVLEGVILPKRYRENSGKRLFGFRYESPMPKRVIPVDGGIIEFLGDGQQFVAAGNHDSGVPYLWDCADGLPSEFPVLTDDELNAVWSTLVALFATGAPTIAREKRLARADVVQTTDEFAAYLYEHWDVYDTGSTSELFLRCPFEAEHTSESGITSTAYFVAGTGGYERGHWVCLHAHCMGRTDEDFIAATGYRAASFSALPEPAVNTQAPATRQRGSFATHDPLVAIEDMGVPMPALERDANGKIEANADNLNKLLHVPEAIGMELAEDTFRGSIVWAPPNQDEPQWREFSDNDYVTLEIALHRRGVKPVSHDTLRRWVRKVANDREIDTAKEWLSRLRWDGVPRVETFLIGYLGTTDDDHGYNRAVARYMWTAMAGRVMVPGIQADMVPIFYGDQGARKTSAIRALVPDPTFYTTLDLGTRDDDTARLMRGTLVAELEELRGLKSRDAESIKAWVTKTWDKWTPKYIEFAKAYSRRTFLLGTTNRDDFLGDDTGERRWLPTRVAIDGGTIDVERIVRDREQLWAEGAFLFLMDGIAWADAERLAPREHEAYKATDEWEGLLERWLLSPNVAGTRPADELALDGLSVYDIGAGIGLGMTQMDKTREARIGKAMRRLGYSQRRVGAKKIVRWFA